jgi:hypothetical protein
MPTGFSFSPMLRRSAWNNHPPEETRHIAGFCGDWRDFCRKEVAQTGGGLAILGMVQSIIPLHGENEVLYRQR